MIPGRLQLLNATFGKIAVTYGNEIWTNPWFRLEGSGEYLVVRDGCKCSWMEPQIASNHPGLVRTAENAVGNAVWGPNDFLISRINASDNRVSIGLTWPPFYKTKYTNPATNVEVVFSPSKEVLVCESDQDMSTKPTLNFGNKACGLWTKYQKVNINWPATNGFSFGLDRFNKTAYVGRGSFADIHYIGRINTGGSAPNVYLTDANEPIATVPEYLVVPNNCICSWIAYATAVSKVGVVRSIDFTNGFGIGRVDLGGGKYAVSSVHYNAGWQKYIDINGIVQTNYSPSVLLVCETV